MAEDIRPSREPVSASEVLYGVTRATGFLYGAIRAEQTTGVRSSRDNDQWGE
jgi:hypothetical protein